MLEERDINLIWEINGPKFQGGITIMECSFLAGGRDANVCKTSATMLLIVGRFIISVKPAALMNSFLDGQIFIT